MSIPAQARQRCDWVGQDPLMVDYHDTEWGRPEYRSVALFEKLMLDGFQAGLSWRTILHRRDGMRRALWNFDVSRLAKLTDSDLLRLRSDKRLIRHPKKIQAIRSNAQAYCDYFTDVSFSDWLWEFAPPQRGHAPTRAQDVPTETEESQRMSQSLRERGFSFCGPTICYAFMQAVGMVDDHLDKCFLSE